MGKPSQHNKDFRDSEGIKRIVLFNFNDVSVFIFHNYFHDGFRYLDIFTIK
jgi:hypothetical protein